MRELHAVELAPVLQDGRVNLSLDRPHQHALPQVAPFVVVVLDVAFLPPPGCVVLSARPGPAHVVYPVVVESQAGAGWIRVRQVRKDNFARRHWGSCGPFGFQKAHHHADAQGCQRPKFRLPDLAGEGLRGRPTEWLNWRGEIEGNRGKLGLMPEPEPFHTGTQVRGQHHWANRGCGIPGGQKTS